MPSDFRRGRRLVDPDVIRAAHVMLPLDCAACGRSGANLHHVLPKGSPYFGDDVIENLIRLCGTGTGLCHGAFHGNAYIDHKHVRWSPAKVKAAIGATLQRTRPETIRYALMKLGAEAGADYLLRVYRLEVDPLEVLAA